MIDPIAHRGIEFVGNKRDQTDLRLWFENLPESDVKAAVRRVKRRQYRAVDGEDSRLTVLCDHPFAELARELKNASGGSNHLRSDCALSALLASFTRWIESREVPGEVIIGEKHAIIDWWPVEMLDYISDDLSPQMQAQIEMSNHIIECLDFIRLVTISGPEFLALWMNSNEPFFAAGRLYYGTFRWVREVPMLACNSDIERGFLLERIGDFPREYLGLVRLSLLAGAESPLLDRIAFVIRRFKIQYASDIPAWRGLARELLEGLDDMPVHTAVAKPPQYGEIDRVCDQLRQCLVNASRGLEDEVPTLINALLPTLEVPSSAAIFNPQHLR